MNYPLPAARLDHSSSSFTPTIPPRPEISNREREDINISCPYSRKQTVRQAANDANEYLTLVTGEALESLSLSAAAT